MTNDATDLQRRTLLLSTAGLVLGNFALGSLTTALAAPAPAEAPSGKAGDFAFLAGSWKIHHRQMKGKQWDEFPGEATCWSVLGGVGSIEELRIPARNFSGLGIRLLDLENRVWSDFWVNAKSGVLGCPGMLGVFENGVGTFLADDVDGDKPIKYRGVWDRITKTSCRWRQGVSRDGGKTWVDSWFMDWTRAS